jgi:subtilisin family serine protease
MTLPRVVTSTNAVTRSLRLALESVPAGRGGVFLTTTLKKTLYADSYLSSNDRRRPARFDARCASNGRQVGSPGTALSAITVGSYDFNNLFESRVHKKEVALGDPSTLRPLVLGKLSAYSNGGPLRTDAYLKGTVVKPDIVAPGQYFTAPASSAPGAMQYLNITGSYQAFNGTSAATPYVAGLAALLMERRPTLSVREFRRLLRDCATKDDATGPVLPNPLWGYGKLDYAAARKMIKAVKKD